VYFLKKWLTFLFTENMSWDNYGKWHIDHVKPCNSFNLAEESEQKICFNWKNLQPLWAKDNLEKGGKIDHNLIEKHLQKINEFSAQLKESELRELSEVLDTNLS